MQVLCDWLVSNWALCSPPEFVLENDDTRDKFCVGCCAGGPVVALESKNASNESLGGIFGCVTGGFDGIGGAVRLMVGGIA